MALGSHRSFNMKTCSHAMLDVPESPGLSPGTDLRRIGADPNHWYPAAWSRDLMPGKTYATAFAASRSW